MKNVMNILTVVVTQRLAAIYVYILWILCDLKIEKGESLKMGNKALRVSSIKKSFFFSIMRPRETVVVARGDSEPARHLQLQTSNRSYKLITNLLGLETQPQLYHF